MCVAGRDFRRSRMAALDFHRKEVIAGVMVGDGWTMVVDVSVVMCNEATM
jgi:hypothetical protein